MSFTNFKGYPVLHLYPYWGGRPTDEISKPTEQSGSGIGYTYAESRAEYPVYRTAFDYLCNGKSAIGDLNELFDSLLGQHGKLWFPSWRNDFTLAGNVSAAATVISIDDVEYSTFYPATPGTGRYIFLYLRGGTWFARKIVDVPGSTSLEMESALGQAVTVAQVKIFSILYLGRFDVDEIEWEYTGPDIARTTLRFAELPQEYALL